MYDTEYLKVMRNFFVLSTACLMFMIGQVSIAAAQETNGDQDSSAATKKTSVAKEKAVPEETLYERLGGYDAISAVVEVFADKLFTDPKVSSFFKGMGTDTRKQFKQKNKNLVCVVTGGPCKIISRSAKTTHGGLGITEADFEVVFQHLVDTLDEFEVPKAEKKELLDIVLTLKPDIVEKK